MQSLITTRAYQMQEADVLTEDQIISSGEEAKIFRRKVERRSVLTDEANRHIFWAVVTLFERGEFTAAEAINWLAEYGIIKPPASAFNPEATLRKLIQNQRKIAEGETA